MLTALRPGFVFLADEVSAHCRFHWKSHLHIEHGDGGLGGGAIECLDLEGRLMRGWVTIWSRVTSRDEGKHVIRSQFARVRVGRL